MSNPLEALARRAENDPFFLASVLARWIVNRRADFSGAN